jgi:hypothetical protein
MKRISCLVFLLEVLIFQSGCFAQQCITVSGKVLDTLSRAPVGGVTVQVVSLLDSSVIAFAITNEQGNYTINLKKSQLPAYLEARAMGFRSTTFSFHQKDSISVSVPPLLLYEAAIDLLEISVKRVIPVAEKGDTITFNPSAFRQGDEKNIEELLKKIPGFRVADNGKITLNGKPVEKVFLEGKDLFSRKYEFITRSLSAGIVTKIEAIDNHAENPLLPSVEKSGELVLNLSIDPTKKDKAFGQLEAVGGSPNRYEGSASLFYLKGKYTTGLLGKANNTGEDIMETVVYELESDGRKSAGGGEPLLVSLLQPTRPFLNGVEKKRYLFTNARLMAWQQNYQPNEKLSVKLLGYFFADQNRWGQKNNVDFLTSGIAIRFADSLNYTSRPTQGAAQLKLSYQPKPSLYITYVSDLKQSKDLSNTSQTTINQVLSDTVEGNIGQSTLIQRHYFSITKKLNDRHLIDIEANRTNAHLPQLATYQSPRYALFFDKPLAFQQLTQEATGTATETNAVVRWKGKYKNQPFMMGAGVIQKRENQFSLVTLSNPSQISVQLEADSLFNNGATLQKNTLFVEGRYGFSLGNYNFLAQSTAQWLKSDYHPASQIDLADKSILFNPSLSINKVWNSNVKANLSASRVHLFPALSNQLSDYSLNSFRTFLNNIPNLTPVRTDRIVVQLGKTNWPKLYMISGGFIWSQTNLTTLSQSQIQDLIGLQTNTLLPIKINRWLAFGKIEKLLYKLSVKIYFETSTSFNQQYAKINSTTIRNSQVVFNEQKLVLISTFDFPLNIETGVGLTTSSIFSKQANSTFQNSNSQLNNHLTVVYRPTQHMVFKVKGNSFIWYSKNSSTSLSLLLDTQWNYTPLDSRWSFSLRMSNLANQKAIIQRDISDILLVQRIQYLQPRMILAGTSFSF